MFYFCSYSLYFSANITMFCHLFLYYAVVQDLAVVCVIHQYPGTLADSLGNDDCLVPFLLLGTSTGSHINGAAQTFESYK